MAKMSPIELKFSDENLKRIEEAARGLQVATDQLVEQVTRVVVTFNEFGVSASKLESLKDTCILSGDSPSFPPTDKELEQCGCIGCVKTLAGRIKTRKTMEANGG